MTAPDPFVGSRIGGRYLVTAIIARGTTGRVYEAEQEPLGRPVALKLLSVRGHVEDHEEQRRRFLREAENLGRLTHPNTVRVFDYGVEEGQAWLAMELVRGAPLSRLVEEGRLDPLRAIGIARQICGSLGEAHRRGLVHRDLKPANVLVETRDGEDRVKVVDFGLAKRVDGAEHLTADGVMLGTPMYMAPEQIRVGTVDRRTDIYALGVILYRAVYGAYPFPEGHTAALLLAHLSEPPTDPGEHGDAVPACLRALIGRCLEKDPAARYQDVNELVAALDRCARMLRGELSDDGDGADERRRWIALGSALVATGIVSLVLGFVAMRAFRHFYMS